MAPPPPPPDSFALDVLVPPSANTGTISRPASPHFSPHSSAPPSPPVSGPGRGPATPLSSSLASSPANAPVHLSYSPAAIDGTGALLPPSLNSGHLPAYNEPSASASLDWRGLVGTSVHPSLLPPAPTIAGAVNPFAAFMLPGSPYYVPPEDLLHYNQAKTFVLKLGRALFSFGLPTYRLETDLAGAASALGLTATFGCLPSSLQASFEHPWGFSEATMVNLTFGLDVGRLWFTNALCRRVSDGDLTLEQATGELEDILINGGLYGRGAILLSFAIGSFAGAPLAFGGGWEDAGVAFVLGLLVGAINLAMADTVVAPLFEFSAAAAVSFLTLVAQRWIMPDLCFSATTLSALLVPLPGLWISTSFIELSSRQIVSGACRMLWAVQLALQLAFGLSIGYNLYAVVLGAPAANALALCGRGGTLSPWWNLLFLPGMSLSLNVLLNAHWKHQFLPMTSAATVSYLLFWTCTHAFSFGIETTSIIVSFVVGVLSNAWSRYSGGGQVETQLCGIILLVPGSVATRFSMSLIDPQVSEVLSPGVGLALRFVVVAMSISVGQIAARIVDGVDIALGPRSSLSSMDARARARRATERSFVE